jgi:hypothetical protein
VSIRAHPWLKPLRSLQNVKGARTISIKMAGGLLKVFRHGKGTHIRFAFEEGQRRQTILRQGAGTFLDPEFKTEQEAADLCSEELRKDPKAILYVVDGDSILRTFLDHAGQEQLKYERARKASTLSVITFCVLSLLIVTFMNPFGAIGANLALAAGLTTLYVLLLFFIGNRNLEAASLMILILILLCMGIASMKHAQERSEKAKHSLVVP